MVDIFCTVSRAVKGVTLKMLCVMLRGFESHTVHGRLAQLVEHYTCNVKATGSNPVATFFN